jgi:glycosyltransferase involved in cell wall biosynthesis
MKISVIIPTYKEPEALDLCLKSAIDGQCYENEIIVVIDGFYNVNEPIISKYKDKIHILDLETNVGLCCATNMGVYNASNELILVVNDDNVFDKDWDRKLLEDYQPGRVLTPNQVEPIPSMFGAFNIIDLGKEPRSFSLEQFWEYTELINSPIIEGTGSTLPFCMSKLDYLRIGGWDEHYPSGMVADWDFFLKCELGGMEMIRTYKCHFYHFVSLTVRDPENMYVRKKQEEEAHQYFKYKWGVWASNNNITNSKINKEFEEKFGF